MNREIFKKGIKDGLPICFGYFSVAFAFGISTVAQGLSVWQAVLISMTNETSAGQLAAVPIIAAGGAVIELIASQFVINLRYSLMSLSLSQKLDDSMGTLQRIIFGFSITDEIFAVASAQKGTVGKHYLYGLMLTPWFGWWLGTLTGAVAGNVLPDIVSQALGIAIYGMFVAIVVPEAKDNRDILALCLIAVALSLLFRYVPLLSSVTEGFVIIICSVVAAGLMAWLKPIRDTEVTAS